MYKRTERAIRHPDTEGLRLEQGDRTIFVCWDRSGGIFIREHGHPALPFGNFYEALKVSRLELADANGTRSTTYDPGTMHVPRFPVTLCRSRSQRAAA